MKIFNCVILWASELPHIQKAHKLARCLTEAELDDILAGRKHLHGNPVRKIGQNPRIIGPSEDYIKAGE